MVEWYSDMAVDSMLGDNMADVAYPTLIYYSSQGDSCVKVLEWVERVREQLLGKT